jgi:hypothetical protein
MSKIPLEWSECVCYIYDSLSDAKTGAPSGGTGFLVGMKAERGRGRFRYLVTNWHVIRDNPTGKPAIRVNLKSGGNDAYEVDRHRWTKHPTLDIAVCPLGASMAEDFLLKDIDIDDWLLTAQKLAQFEIDAGDEVAMVGRFVYQDGKDRNHPVARFGNIARNPTPESPCFLVEMRSIGGFSGSPVFIYPSPIQMEEVRRSMAVPRQLLGIDSAHVPLFEPVFATDDAGELVKVKGCCARSNTSVAKVIPAWNIREVIELPKLKKQRQKGEKAQIALDKLQSADVEDSASNHARFTQDDFDAALKKASRKIAPKPKK